MSIWQIGLLFTGAAVVGLALGWLANWVLWHLRRRSPKQAVVQKAFNAWVADETSGGGREYVPEDKIPESSTARLYRGQWLHFLKRYTDQSLEIIPVDAEVKDGETPSDLYEALECPDAPLLFCSAENPWKGTATKGLWIFIGVCLFILFIMWGVNL